MIKCGVCGGFLTAELKKKKYIYYRCNDYYKNGCKKESYLNQDKIDKTFEELLKRFNFSEKFVSDVLGTIRELVEKKGEYSEEALKAIHKQIETLHKRMEAAYIDKIDGKHLK